MSSSGFDQVGLPLNFTTHPKLNMPVHKNGYLYIYVSNATPDKEVFFDNLQVSHSRGAMLEETHYYPFGLPMAGISKKAFGQLEEKRKYNGIERENDLEIGIYDAQLRELDGQTGRWWQIDPKIENMEMWSPYVSNYDNPITYKDPLGDEPEDGDGCCDNIIDAVTGFFGGFIDGAKSTGQGAASQFNSLLTRPGDPLAALLVGDPVSALKGAFQTGQQLGSELKSGKVKDVSHALGFLSEKLVEIVVLKKVIGKNSGGVVESTKTKGLGNPFKNLTLKEIDNGLQKQVKNGKLVQTNSAPGAKTYKNVKSGYSYNLDPGGVYGKKVEEPHIDVNYSKPKPKNIPKKKLTVAGGF